jgi:homoserine kinase
MKLKIAVPATSANLGPGFDSIGFAVPSITDTLEVSTGADLQGTPVEARPVKVVPGGFNALFGDVAPEDESNMVYDLIRSELVRLNAPQEFSIVCHNNIPHARGLGSSSAAIVSALRAAYRIAKSVGVDVSSAHLGSMSGLAANTYDGGADPDNAIADENAYVFAQALEIEGHPDNIAPCIFGGVQLATPDGQGVTSVKLPRPLQVAVQLNPARGLKTKDARAVMPKSVPYADAMLNSRNFANLIQAFHTGDNTNLLLATKDYLHQEYRRELYPESMMMVDLARKYKIPTCISGAGTTVVSFWFEDDEILDRYHKLFPPEKQSTWVQALDII